MFFSNLRRNKENILYFILTILCLEYVRTHYNKLEDRARENKWRFLYRIGIPSPICPRITLQSVPETD